MAKALKIEAESTLTDRYQTTVPETVRRVLSLRKRDKIRYTVLPSGDVLITNASPVSGVDPVLGHFLEFIERDLKDHPEQIKAIDASLIQRISSLVGGTAIDLDAPLLDEDE